MWQSAIKPLALYTSYLDNIKDNVGDKFKNKDEYVDEYIYYIHSGIINDIGSILVSPPEPTSNTNTNTKQLPLSTPTTPTCVISPRKGCEKLSPPATVKWTKKCAIELKTLHLSWWELFNTHSNSNSSNNININSDKNSNAHSKAYYMKLMEHIYTIPYIEHIKKMKKRLAKDATSNSNGGAGSGSASNLTIETMGLPDISEFSRKSARSRPLCGLNVTLLYDVLLNNIDYIDYIDANTNSNIVSTYASFSHNTVDTTPLKPYTPPIPPIPPSPVIYESVFVLTTVWDHNYHHFLIDAVVKLVPYLPLLRQNPHMHIHIRRYEQYCKRERYIKGGLSMRKRIWELLGLVNPVVNSVVNNGGGSRGVDISSITGTGTGTGTPHTNSIPPATPATPTIDRIISGGILAKHIYLPKSTECNWVLGSSHKIHMLANYLLWEAYLDTYGREKIRIDALKPNEYKHIHLVLQEIQSMQEIIINQDGGMHTNTNSKSNRLLSMYDLIPFYTSYTYTFHLYYNKYIKKSKSGLGSGSGGASGSSSGSGSSIGSGIGSDGMKVNKVLLQIRHCQEKKTCQNDWR